MTTSRKSWKVWRDHIREARGDDPWIGAPSRHWVYAKPRYAFPTHAEALAYADRMARTIEVILPRATGDCEPIPGSPREPENSIWYGRRKDGAYWLDIPPGRSNPLAVSRDELAPLALALLALHYKVEKQ